MARFETIRRCGRLVNDSVFADCKLIRHHWRGHYSITSSARASSDGGNRRSDYGCLFSAVCVAAATANKHRCWYFMARSQIRSRGDPVALLTRRRTRLSRGIKDILVTGITVTMLLTSAATASAQNIFEALFGGLGLSPGPVPDANFTARDRQQLANP